MEDKLIKIKHRKIVPIAAMISAGKSKILNTILNVKFLESNTNITTKFVNIMRYNPEVTETIFYHLKIKKENEEYIYYQDLSYETKKGDEAVIKENKNINKKLSSEKNVDYNDIFYMTEINDAKFIEDKQYLLSHDLCDIPGLSEYQKQQNDDSEKVTYLTEIFKRLKYYIDGCIFVFSIENYQNDENFEILKKLHEVIGKNIANFLVILNKLDLSKDPEEDIKKCKEKLIKKFQDFEIFNLNWNTFVPISAFNLENELLMSVNFSNFIKYLFDIYKEEINKSNDNNNITFISYLASIIRNKTSETIKKTVEELNKNNNEINKKIKEIIRDIVEQSKGNNNINLGININYDKEEEEEEEEEEYEIIKIIKMIYILYEKNELSLHRSKETNEILKYFTTKNYESKNSLISLLNEKSNNNPGKNNEIIENLASFCEEFKNSINYSDKFKNLILDVEKIISYLKISNNIYIPFLGESNSGKSTIINSIIGKDLLPTNLGVCTKRCVIIKYKNNDDIVMKKLELKTEEFFNKSYYYFEEKKCIGIGEANILELLTGLNYEYNEKEEDSYYCIETRIKLFDDLEFDENLKDKICLIDFPGYCDGNIYEKKIYEKVMTICNTFIFIVRNSVIKENYTQSILDQIFQQAKEQKHKLSSEFIKSCLFILNNFTSTKIENSDLEKAKNDIKEIIGGINVNDIKLCFFNALYYLGYVNFYNYFFDLDKTLKDEYDNFGNYKSRIYNKFFHPISTFFNTFNDYLLEKLNTKINRFDKKFKSKTQSINDNIKNKVINTLLQCEGNENEKQKENIIKRICFGQENIKELKTLKESNIDEFKESFFSQIRYVNNYMQHEIKNNIHNVIKILDPFFTRDFSEIKEDSQKKNNFEQKMKECTQNIMKLKLENNDNIKEIRKKYKENVLNSLNNKKSHLEVLLKNQDYKKILNEINIEINIKIKNLMDEIKKFLDDNDSKKCFDLIKNAKTIIKDFNVGNIKIIPIMETGFKKYISDKISDGKKDLGDELCKEIMNNCEDMKAIWKKKSFIVWFQSFFSSEIYLKNIIEIIYDKLSESLDSVINLIKFESDNYLDEAMVSIDHNITNLTLSFTNQQRDKWKKLGLSYETIKNKINNIINK